MTFSSVLLALSLQTASVTEEPAQQVDAYPKPNKEIIVEAPPARLERQKELREMITAISRKPRRGRTVGTFFEAICPRVEGVPEGAAKVIEQRIAQNAATLGANRRDPSQPCNHNVLIKFIPADRGPPAEWLTYESDVLAHLLSFEKRRILEEEGPVRAWNTVQLRSSDGIPIPESSKGKFLLAENRLRSSSRLRNLTMTEIRSAVVLIELASANGKTLQQLADYATIRTLASTSEIAADTAPAATTILTLFEDDEPVEELTTFDKAFISGLYAKSRNSPPKRYYSSIAATAANEEIAERQKSAQ